ncbi:MAG: response regulator, partial [Candidatus Nanopelagicales bacterium]
MSDSGGMSDDGRRRVLLVEDEEFTRTMVSEALEANGLTVRSVATVAEALSSIEDFEPHAVISDLDLGGGPSGADLLNRIADETPWVGLVVLTSHASPELAIRPGTKLPAHVSYVMKAQVNSSGDLLRAVESAIADTSFTLGATVNTDGRPIISA